MHLLVGITNNLQEWRETLIRRADKPRLPLAYAFGGAFIKRGHRLSAINLSCSSSIDGYIHPFESVYPMQHLSGAMKNADLVSLWGGNAISAILKQVLLAPPRKRVVLNSYVWKVDRFSTFANRKLGIATRIASRFAKAIVVMTIEQADMVRAALSGKIPVISFRCGIDTAFYRVPSSFADVPEEYREKVEKLLTKPYIILSGDELRFNRDALDLVSDNGIPLVRISQYSKEEMLYMREEIKRRRIESRVFIFERINYLFMRFLLQHATVYAGLVNSEWQPAGWTVAVEALASGLPVVTYDGLTAREIVRLGASSDIFRSVPINDIRAFWEATHPFVNEAGSEDISKKAQSFAAEVLDLENTADDFVRDMERLL